MIFSRCFRFVSWILAITATGYLFLLSATWGHFNWEAKRDVSNFWRLSDAFLQGQLHLPLEPSPKLLALPNPYEHVERVDVEYVWDASLYRGRYYLYFGPIPALVAYIPHKVLFGSYPSDDLVIFVFSLLAAGLLYVACRLVSVRLTRVAAPGPGAVWFLYIVFASSLSVQLGGAMYVVAATSAMFFQVVALIALIMLISNSRGGIAWAFLAGLAMVGGIGSRPTHVMLVVIAAVVFAVLTWGRSTRPITRGQCFAFVAPLALGGLLLAAYNYARFGDPTEFGISYQLGLADLRERSICSIRGVLEQPQILKIQAWYTFLQNPTLLPNYPYLDFSSDKVLRTTVQGYLAADNTTGLLWLSPLMLPGLFATLLFWRRISRSSRTFFVVSLLTALAGGAYLHTCFATGGRYLFEIIAPLTTVCLPMLWVACAQTRGRANRSLWLAVTTVGLLAGILIGALGSVHGYLQKGSHTAAVFEGAERKARHLLGIEGEPSIRSSPPLTNQATN